MSVLYISALITLCTGVRLAFVHRSTEYGKIGTTLLGQKTVMAHSGVFFFSKTVGVVFLALNVTLRFVRYKYGVYVPTYVDTFTYMLAVFAIIANFLFFAQLLPYVGYIAVVLKLMLKDTLIFFSFIVVFAIPYTEMFTRLSNSKKSFDQCSSAWGDFMSTFYSTFLLLFNMINFKRTDSAEDDHETVQLYVSI